MASRSSRTAPQPSSSRQNEYFVPRDGIDREVISADICRYLGNDALVRPGMYEVRHQETLALAHAFHSRLFPCDPGGTIAPPRPICEMHDISRRLGWIRSQTLAAKNPSLTDLLF